MRWRRADEFLCGIMVTYSNDEHDVWHAFMLALRHGRRLPFARHGRRRREKAADGGVYHDLIRRYMYSAIMVCGMVGDGRHPSDAFPLGVGKE